MKDRDSQLIAEAYNQIEEGMLGNVAKAGAGAVGSLAKGAGKAVKAAAPKTPPFCDLLTLVVSNAGLKCLFVFIVNCDPIFTGGFGLGLNFLVYLFLF